MNRREFLYDSAILTAGAIFFSEFPAFAKVIKAKGQPLLSIGILSDIHITDAASCDTFRHALEYFRDSGVDGVMVAGDMADHGLLSELQLVAGTWFSVFPDNKAPDGSHVEPLFIYGNHDVNNWKSTVDKYGGEAAWSKLAVVTDRKKAWEECFREPYEPIFMKNIKGYNFIGAHWCNKKTIYGVPEFLEAHRDELKGRKPFFYFQHAHPKDTCNGAWAWGQDDGTVTKALGNFPNAVAFSGHSHNPLTDERDLWQGTFTSVGTSSLRYQYPIGARENSRVDDGPKENTEMPQISCWDGRQGMLMRVYKDCIALEKREFVYDEPLGASWIIPLGELKSFEERAKTAEVPQFRSGDKVTITRGEGQDRRGDTHKQVTVHFPSVLKKTHGVRAFDYEVQVEMRWVDHTRTGCTKRVFSPKCYLGENMDMGEVTCVFAESELPEFYEVRFAVRPCECFGGKGAPIYSEWEILRT